ncbi:MAG TPA: HAMP domain-containing protein [Methylomirabilota bacterium]|nr:HAMP domain-containing protein [Methylomirabilota bacterium]
MTARPDPTAEAPTARLRFGLLAKLVLFIAVGLILLSTAAWTISVQTLRHSLTEEFTSKGAAIANSLASSSVDLILTRDASTVQALVDQFAAIRGVAYVMVYDPEKTLIAHTFSPRVPRGILEKNLVTGEVAQQVQEIQYPDPVTGAEKQIIDVGVPMLGGQLGTVRVGMNRAIVDAATARAGQFILLAFGGVAVVAVLAAVLFARRLTRPVVHLASAAQRIGQGDLSELVPVTSRDEIGQLAATFNEAVVRLRSLVKTEAERDEFEKLSTYMEQLYRLSTAMQEALSLKDQLTRVLEAARQVVAVDRFFIWAITPDGHKLVALVTAGLPEEDRKASEGAETSGVAA